MQEYNRRVTTFTTTHELDDATRELHGQPRRQQSDLRQAAERTP